MHGAGHRSRAHFQPQRPCEFSSGYRLGGLEQGVQVTAGKSAGVVHVQERGGRGAESVAEIPTLRRIAQIFFGKKIVGNSVRYTFV